MKTSRFTKALAFLLLLGVFAGLAAHPSDAQKARTARRSGSKAPATPDLTPAAIQAKIDALTANTILDEKVRTRALDLYQQALKHVLASGEAAQQAAEFEKNKQDTPTLLKTIKNELATPLPSAVPTIALDISLSDVEQALAQAESELASAQDKVNEIDEEMKRRSDRRLEVPNLLSAARLALDELQQQVNASSTPGTAQEEAIAKLTLLLAKKKALEDQIKALESELSSYEARGELLSAKRDIATRKITQSDQKATGFREAVNEARRLEAEQAAIVARQARASALPALKSLAEENAALAEERTGQQGLVANLEGVTKNYATLQTQLEKIRNDFDGIKGRIQAAGLTTANGLFLLKKKADLPNVWAHKKQVRARQPEISRVQLRLIDLEEQRQELADIGQKVEDILSSLPPTLTPEELNDTGVAARDLLISRRKSLEALNSDYEAYFMTLVDSDTAELSLIEAASALDTYIGEHIFWIRSTSFLGLSEFIRAGENLVWLFGWEGLSQTVFLAFANVTRNPLPHLLTMVLVLLMMKVRPEILRRLQDIGDIASKGRKDTLPQTLYAFLLTIIYSAFLPAFFVMAAWLLSAPLQAPDQAKAYATGLWTAFHLLLTLEIIKNLFRPQGICVTHFRWNEEGITTIRKEIQWLEPALLPLIFLHGVVQWQSHDSYKEALGRLALLAIMGVFAGFAYRILRPKARILENLLGSTQASLPGRFSSLVLPLGLTPFAGLGILAIIGYYYTAYQLTWLLLLTFWFGGALILIYTFFLRWQKITNRNLARKLALAKRAFREAEAKESPEEIPVIVEETIDLATVSDQTLRIAHTLLAFALVIGLFFIWQDVFPALNILDRVVLYYHTSQITETVTAAGGTSQEVTAERRVPITLANFFLALIIVTVAILLSKNLPGLLESTILNWLPIDHGGRYAITTTSRYGITLIGMVAMFGALGVGWRDVQWLAAAVSVGLGFGLQEIFANFVSGMIIFLERPVRVGDTVTIGAVTGKVSRIQIRATTITDWNMKELIVPNKEFITGQLVNWTLSSNVLRLEIPVGIAYGSDTALAKKEMLRIANEHPNILSDPAPTTIFSSFGDNSLNLILRAFVDSIDHFITAKDDLHFAIDQAFRKAGIEISFPQMDLHIRSFDTSIPIKVSPE